MGCEAAAPLGSDGVALEAPVVALALLQHLPEGGLPLAGLLVLLLDPQGHLHHAAGDVPVAPQGLDGLVVVPRPRRLVEQGPPGILVLADQLNLVQRVLGLPLLHLLPDLANRRLCRHGNSEHAQRRQHLDLRDVVLVALCNLCRTLLDQPTLLIPDLAVRGSVLSEDDLLALLFCHAALPRELFWR